MQTRALHLESELSSTKESLQELQSKKLQMEQEHKSPMETMLQETTVKDQVIESVQSCALHLESELSTTMESRKATAEKKKEVANELVELAPAARNKLNEKGGDINSITKKEISAILFVDHGYHMDEKKFVKARMVEKLQEFIAAATAAASEEA